MAIWVYIRLWYSPSTVFSLSVAGPAVFHPRSEDFPSRVRSWSPTKLRTGDANLADRGRNSHGPGTVRWWTRDGKTTDRGRKTYGLGTVRCWTGDGKPTDRGRHDGGPETQRPRTRDGTVLDRGRKTYGPDTKRPRPRDTKQPRDTEQPKEFCYSLAKNFQWNRIK